MSSPAIQIEHVSHCYGARRALDDVGLTINCGEVFALVGPNGGGKTTLFRLLATLVPLQQGQIRILGRDLSRAAAAVRRQLGVVFQAPSLDRQLTVRENLRHQGHLYGLWGAKLRSRSDELLAALDLASRADDRVETLSGGLKRRVEIAKCLLHEPAVLLLDEPSTGLDPAVRGDLWAYLQNLRQRAGVTVVLTTHLLDEADKADRIGILHQGRLAALDSPAALRATVGGDAINIAAADPQRLSAAIRERWGLDARVVDGQVRLEQPRGHEWIARLVEAFGDEIVSITLGKPSLEDVFVARTGHRFWAADEAA